MKEVEFDDPLGLLKGKKFDDPLGLLKPKKQDIGQLTDYPVLAGVGKGMLDIGRGAYQRALEAGSYFTGPSASLREEATKAGKDIPETLLEKKLREFKGGLAEEREIIEPFTKESTRFKAGEILGQTAALVPIPGGVTGGLLTRIGTSAAAGGLIGLLQPTEEKESVAGNIFYGTVGGASVPVILAPVGKGFNIITGKVADKYKQIIKLSETNEVPLTLGEIVQNPIVKRLEKYLEYIPFVGLRKFRNLQGEATERLARDTMGKYGAGSISEAQERMQVGLLKGLEKAKAKVEIAYKELADEIKLKGGDGIPVTNTRTEVLEMLNEYPNILAKLDDTNLETKINIIAKGTRPVVIQGPQGQPMTIPKTLNFDDANWLRKRLGNAIDKAYKKKGVGEIGSEEVNFLSRIKAKLDQDIEDWGNAHPNSNVVALSKRARQIYRKEVVPYKDTLINEALNIHYDTDRMFKTFVKPDRVLLAGKLIAGMEPEGVEAVKYAILKNAYDAASPEVKGLKVFSPNIFSTKIKQFSEINKEVFNPQEVQQLKGIANLMSYAGEAGQRMADPATGQRLGPLLTGGALWEFSRQLSPYFGGGAGGAVLAAGTGLGMIEGITLALTTAPGRRLLLSASKIEPSHPVMRKIVDKIYNLSSKAGAAMAVQE